MQCIYCHQIRAKNTSRQKQHLLECPGLRNAGGIPPQPTSSPAQNLVPDIPRPDSSSSAEVAGFGPAFSINGAANALDGATAALNGTPLQNRPSMTPTVNGNGTPAPRQSMSMSMSKPKPTPKQTAGSSIPAPPLEDVHSAFVEVRTTLRRRLIC